MTARLLLVAGLLGACGGGSGANPERLYLALLDSELTVQLTPDKPDPF